MWQVTTTSGSAPHGTARPVPATSPSTISDASRQVEQVGQRLRVAADHHLARGQDGRELGCVEDDGVRGVGHGAVEGADPVRGVEVGGIDPAVDDRVGERGVSGGDERGVGAAVRVGEAGEQVRGVAGVGDGQLGAHPGGDEHGVVGGAWAAPGSSAAGPGSGS